MGQLQAYVIRRSLLVLPLLVGLSMIIFLLVHLAPGDPALAFVSEQNNDPEVLAQIRKDLGLDQPIPVQYVKWMGQIVQGDFGTAYTFNSKPVLTLIRERAWPTVQIQALSIVLALALALPVGIVSATRQYSWIDNSSTVGAFIGLAIPQFWLALLLQLFLGVRLGWLPIATRGQDVDGLERARYYVLPVVVLAVPLIAAFARFMRSSMLEVIRQDYINTARAKGLSERKVLYRHALRNALIPMVTVIGLQLPRMLSGGVIVEAIFAWPGLGLLGYEAILRRDYPIILALTVISGAFLLVLNIIVDVIYVLVDPRIAYDGESR
jgi:peptide/nickel transport system permease protein